MYQSPLIKTWRVGLQALYFFDVSEKCAVSVQLQYVIDFFCLPVAVNRKLNFCVFPTFGINNICLHFTNVTVPQGDFLSFYQQDVTFWDGDFFSQKLFSYDLGFGDFPVAEAMPEQKVQPQTKIQGQKDTGDQHQGHPGGVIQNQKAAKQDAQQQEQDQYDRFGQIIKLPALFHDEFSF